MNEAKILVYDGSFNGYLTAVFQAFEQKLDIADIQKLENAQSGLFSVPELTYTDIDKAKKVWDALDKKSCIAVKNIYFAFLSESRGIELLLYRYIQQLFAKTDILNLNFSDDIAAKVNHLAKLVGKEKQRIEGLVRFKLNEDRILISSVSSEYDILPLISRHFKSTKAKQKWLIYDEKRKYGIFYNLESVAILKLDTTEVYSIQHKNGDVRSNNASDFQETWNGQMKTGTIITELNKQLHAACA